MSLEIKHEFENGKGRFFIPKRKKTLAETIYSMAGENQLIIEHTEVSDKLKGKGAGKELVYKVVELAREKNLKVIPLCPFANLIFRKYEEIRDVL